MLTVAFYVLILTALLVISSGLTDAARQIASFLARRQTLRRRPAPRFLGLRTA